ncbi:hypothetical protein GCM10011374_11660 [Kocuria dechangensis]|uniref:Uncharacterized protein n=1 Tax=Kocuria dechangensis TaxID=1176249 RepID=A0A917GLX0_9MICC|nr:hypothetical protein GCM10011374_11660 [Kocuria dechangensis]
MARRAVRAADRGPAVPRWCVEFHEESWPGGFREWSSAVRAWIQENLYAWEHYGAWIDITRNIYVTQDELRARGYWANADRA